MADVNIVKGETITFGHPEAYGFGRPLPTGTLVYIEGETFIEVGGHLHTLCGYCDTDHPGVKGWAAHVLGGVCFQCRGFGTRKAIGTADDAVKIAKRRIAARNRTAAKEAKRLAAMEVEHKAWVALNPLLAEALAAIATEVNHEDTAEGWAQLHAAQERWGSFVIDMALIAQHRALSAKQTVAVEEAIEASKAHAEEVAAEQAKARYTGTKGEKITVAGEVIVWTTVEDNYNPYGGTKALIVVKGTGEHDGVTVKMIGTAQSFYDCSRGDHVEVTGKVKDHAEYQGTPQTVLNYAKVKVLVAAEA